MLQEITLEKVKGKTITDYGFSIIGGQMVIVFSDNTFTTLGVLRGWEQDDEEIEESELELFKFADDTLIKLGIITAEELKAIESEKERKYAEAQEIQEKAQYERLKKKYES